MGRLIYSAIASLDGYIEDADGNFDWSAPDAEVHAFVNEREAEVGTMLLGRKMYETLKVWERPEDFAGDDETLLEFARIWRAAEKVVYSGSLDAVETARTRVETTFDPGAVRELKDSSDRALSIGGAALAAEALRAGLVDELQLLASPVVVGGGKHWLPDGLRLELELIDERRFANGVVHMQYRVS